MKNSNLSKYLLVSSLLLSVLPIGACTVAHEETVGEHIDDSVITARIKASILNESSLKSHEIHVETFQSVVQLTGVVSSKALSKKAEKIANNTPNVKEVKNNIVIR